ncbi:MAG: IreB family regulatory phosphoprotein [Bacilli bacterium]|nr:IreB family regulatory phosphoprotein [Bacilli bacterium]
MNTEETNLFRVEELNVYNIRKTLQEIIEALEERGYNASNQIVGYLISGDLGYISSHKDARKKMQELDRAEIVEVLLKEFQKQK